MAEKTSPRKRKIVILYSVLALSILAMIGFGGALIREVRVNNQGQAFFEAAAVEFVPRPVQSMGQQVQSIQPGRLPGQARNDAHEIQNDEYETWDDECETWVEFERSQRTRFAPFLDFDEKREIFPNIVGWIQSEGTAINYPIVQGRDNDFYLHHLPDNTRHKWGSIFLDYRNASDFSDSNILIHGHDMASGDMFGSLKNYRNQEFFDRHPSMFLFTPHQNHRINLVAGYVLNSTQEVPPMKFADSKEFDSFITDIRKRSVFDSPIEVNYGDRLVFLATCTSGGSRHERLVLVGKQSAIPMPTASGISIRRNGNAELDYSNIHDGYVMARFAQPANDVKVVIVGPSGAQYRYNLNTEGRWDAFPITGGDGSYTIKIGERVDGNRFSVAISMTIDVALTDEFAPFLRPSQFVNFNNNSRAVAKAAELVKGSTSVIDRVSRIYNFVIENIEYDFELAATVATGFIPDIDRTLERRKGICFCYAALMTAMLRSQGIPTRLVKGYVGSVFHAWISVHSPEYGWINNIIHFDGINWQLMDPTFAATSNESQAFVDLIGTGTSHMPVYVY